MRWPGHVGNIERREKHTLSVEKLEAKNHSEDLGVDGMILKWIVKIDWRARTGLTWPGVDDLWEQEGGDEDFSHGKYEEK